MLLASVCRRGKVTKRCFSRIKLPRNLCSNPSALWPPSKHFKTINELESKYRLSTCATLMSFRSQTGLPTPSARNRVCLTPGAYYSIFLSTGPCSSLPDHGVACKGPLCMNDGCEDLTEQVKIISAICRSFAHLVVAHRITCKPRLCTNVPCHGRGPYYSRVARENGYSRLRKSCPRQYACNPRWCDEVPCGDPPHKTYHDWIGQCLFSTSFYIETL